MTDLEKLVDTIEFALDNPRVTRDRGTAANGLLYSRKRTEPRRDILRNVLGPLVEERDRLKMTLSSGLCSAHQEPDPLNCRVCNKLVWLETANNTLRAQK